MKCFACGQTVVESSSDSAPLALFYVPGKDGQERVVDLCGGCALEKQKMNEEAVARLAKLGIPTMGFYPQDLYRSKK